jgi:hypothetical protein
MVSALMFSDNFFASSVECYIPCDKILYDLSAANIAPTEQLGSTANASY